MLDSTAKCFPAVLRPESPILQVYPRNMDKLMSDPLRIPLSEYGLAYDKHDYGNRHRFTYSDHETDRIAFESTGLPKQASPYTHSQVPKPPAKPEDIHRKRTSSRVHEWDLETVQKVTAYMDNEGSTPPPLWPRTSAAVRPPTQSAQSTQSTQLPTTPPAVPITPASVPQHQLSAQELQYKQYLAGVMANDDARRASEIPAITLTTPAPAPAECGYGDGYGYECGMHSSESTGPVSTSPIQTRPYGFMELGGRGTPSTPWPHGDLQQQYGQVQRLSGNGGASSPLVREQGRVVGRQQVQRL
ncbi:MAG: hypothetical protein MMC33_009129 [Icmadophila ericetorum]|nr:hypothetical protein [Icmadophila ericetorum]